jgi:hypothetical protein
MWWHRENIVA